jgi:hypothetical protein
MLWTPTTATATRATTRATTRAMTRDVLLMEEEQQGLRLISRLLLPFLLLVHFIALSLFTHHTTLLIVDCLLVAVRVTRWCGSTLNLRVL